jgi:hypothetical protein
MTEMRRESDSLGVVEVPGDKLWGAQTQRSLEHFSIGKPCWLFRRLRSGRCSSLFAGTLGVVTSSRARWDGGGLWRASPREGGA